jgi:hypothetical protein
MITIKFSHFYKKMPRDYKLSKLLDVFNIKLEELSEYFLKYDTTYEERIDDGVNSISQEERYPLPNKGDYMILLLQAGSGRGQIWTTIRRRTDDKEKYYRGHIGEIVNCEVTT